MTQLLLLDYKKAVSPFPSVIHSGHYLERKRKTASINCLRPQKVAKRPWLHPSTEARRGGLGTFPSGLLMEHPFPLSTFLLQSRFFLDWRRGRGG